MKFYNWGALLCSIWFTLTSSLWAYLANFFISYPVGLLGLFFWYKGYQLDKTNAVNRVAKVILITGLSISVISFFVFYFFN